jgi:hypothetical protein
MVMVMMMSMMMCDFRLRFSASGTCAVRDLSFSLHPRRVGQRQNVKTVAVSTVGSRRARETSRPAQKFVTPGVGLDIGVTMARTVLGWSKGSVSTFFCRR